MKNKIEVKVTKAFTKRAKPLLKKYPSLRQDLLDLQNELLKNPESGAPLGNHCFKIRLAIKSKGKGKSGGARVITFLETEIIGYVETNKEKQITVNLLSVYNKSEVATITDKELKELIANIEYEE